MTAVAATTFVLPQASVRFVAAAATASFVDAEFSVTYVAAAAIAALDNTGLNKKFRDVVSAGDTPVRSFGKRLVDSAAVPDLARLATTKPFSDAVTTADVINIVKTILRTFSETVTISEITVLSSAKLLRETVVISEAPRKAVAKLLADAFAMNDGTGVGDGSTWVYDKYINNVSFVTDSAVRSAGKLFADSTTFSESGSVISQGYCDLTYFEADYVGQARTFA